VIFEILLLVAVKTTAFCNVMMQRLEDIFSLTGMCCLHV